MSCCEHYQGFQPILHDSFRTERLYSFCSFDSARTIWSAQDNMNRMEGETDPVLKVRCTASTEKHRKPSTPMLAGIDALLIDLQDVGARLYTYIWTVKLCIEACCEKGIPVWILDRPNPSEITIDGLFLKKEFFTFVGGPNIPLCHRMTHS